MITVLVKTEAWFISRYLLESQSQLISEKQRRQIYVNYLYDSLRLITLLIPLEACATLDTCLLLQTSSIFSRLSAPTSLVLPYQDLPQ